MSFCTKFKKKKVSVRRKVKIDGNGQKTTTSDGGLTRSLIFWRKTTDNVAAVIGESAPMHWLYNFFFSVRKFR